MTKLRFIGKVPESLMQISGKPKQLKKGDIVEVSDRWVRGLLEYKQQIVTQHIKKEKDTDFNITTYTVEYCPAYELADKKKDTIDNKKE